MTTRQSVLILSDTHGQLHDGIARLSEQVDWVVHCGDIGDAHVLGRLQPRNRVVTVLGNNEAPSRARPEDSRLFDSLPESAELALPGGVLAVVHGHRHNPARRRHELLRRRFPAVRAIAYGHSHKWLIDDALQPLVINPGAAGRDRTHGGPSCLLLQASSASWFFSFHRFSLKRTRSRR